MKINSIITNQTFGKTPVMKCEIKKSRSNENAQATLYKMDCSNEFDLDEVKYSKNAGWMYNQMRKDSLATIQKREYYILKDNKTNEVISSAQTSHHFRADNVEYSGFNTLIEDMTNNRKYINPEEVMLAYFANKAFNQFDSSLSLGYFTDDTRGLKHNNFSETKNGDWIIPQSKFLNLIEEVSKRHQMEFII